MTAVDGSPEMIERNRRRLGASSSNVAYVLADLFAWEPDRTYDAVVCCFWLSHVPRERLGGFAANLAHALRPGGHFFFLDGKRAHTSTAVDHDLPADGEEVMTRRLNDGSTYRIVKNFWPSAELERTFSAVGLQVIVRETPTYFQYGVGVRGE